MIIVAFALFAVLVVAWLCASNSAEGTGPVSAPVERAAAPVERGVSAVS